MAEFVISKTSNHGTENPIVARLAIQTDRVLSWSSLPKEKRDEVMKLYVAVLMPRLLQCDDQRLKLVADVSQITAAARFSDDGRVMYADQIPNLSGEVETFLYQAKNFIRDVLQVLKIFFDCPLTDANVFADLPKKGATKLEEWATKEFGADDRFTQMIREEQDWAGRVIRLRNAVEHPGGMSGTIHFLNFRAIGDKLATPSFHLDDDPPGNLTGELAHIVDSLLELAEDLLLSCVYRTTKHLGMIAFYLIPEAERDPKSPVRMTVSLSPEMIKKLKVTPPK